MNEDGRPPEYAEIWVGANRTRSFYLAHLFAMTVIAPARRWKLRQRQPPPEKAGQHPLSKPANDIA
jgi:hypothetical protein